MNNRINAEDFQNARSWPLGSTTSQVEFLDAIRNKYEKKPFMQQVPSIHAMVSESCQFNWNKCHFANNKSTRDISKISKLVGQSQPSLVSKSSIKSDSQKSNHKSALTKDINKNSKPTVNDKKANKHTKSQSKFKDPAKYVSVTSFNNLLSASETLIFNAKMQTQQWILPTDLHLLIKVLKNILMQMDQQEPKMDTVALDMQLLFSLELNSKNNNNSKPESIASNTCTSTKTNSGHVEESSTTNKYCKVDDSCIKSSKIDDSVKTTESSSTKSTRSTSLQSEDTSKITIDQFSLMLEYAWKLFIMKVVKQLTVLKATSIKKEAFYYALRIITAYAISYVRNKVSFASIQDASAVTVKTSSDDKQIKLDEDDCTLDKKSESSNTKSEVKSVVKKESNSLMKLLKRFKSKDATSIEDNRDKSLVSLSFWKKYSWKNRNALSEISVSSVTPTETAVAPLLSQAQFLLENDKIYLVQEEIPQEFPFKYTTMEYLTKNVLKTTTYASTVRQPISSKCSSLRPLTDDPTFRPSPTLKQLTNNRPSTEESVQSSHSTSNISNNILGAASARTVTNDKLNEIEKKSKVFYEILSYMHDKISSRKSSKDENDIMLVLPKSSVACVKPIRNVTSTITMPLKEEDSKPTFDGFLFSKPKVLGNSGSHKMLSVTKQPETFWEKKFKEAEFKVIKCSSDRSSKTSSKESINNSYVLPSVSMMRPYQRNTHLPVSSQTSMNSCAAASPTTLPTPDLMRDVQTLLLKYIFLKNVSDKVSVSQNTSFSCLRPRYKCKSFKSLDRKKASKCLNEQKLKELLRTILEEIEIEKESKKAVGSLIKEENRKISSSTSTNTLQMNSKKSKSTQSSQNRAYGKPTDLFSKTYNKNIVKNTRAKSLQIPPKHSSLKTEYVVHHIPKIQGLGKDNPEVLLEKLYNNVEDNNLINNKSWEDRYENNMSASEKLSKLKLSEFSLIFNLLTIKKNKYNQEKPYICSKTKSNNNILNNDENVVVTSSQELEKGFLSTSDNSENISTHKNPNKGILKKNENQFQQVGVSTSKRKPSYVIYNYENVKKSYTSFADDGILKYKCNDNQTTFRPIKNCRVSQISKLHKHSRHSFSSSTTLARSLMHEYERSSRKVSQELKDNCKLTLANNDIESKMLDNVQDLHEIDASKPVVIQLPIVFLQESSTVKDVLKTENKNKHVTWNLQLHLPQ